MLVLPVFVGLRLFFRSSCTRSHCPLSMMAGWVSSKMRWFSTGFSIRFLKNDRALPMTLVGIEEEGLIICPTNASYRLSEPYREVFVTDKKILEYYNRFYDSVLWKEWTESQEETLRGLRQMKELIET